MADNVQESRVIISGDASGGVRAFGAIGAAAEAATGKIRNSLGGTATSFLNLKGHVASLVGTLTAGGFVAAIKTQVDLMDTAYKSAQAAGVSTQAWSELAYVGRLADVEAELLTKTLAKLSGELVKAAAGDKDARALFEGTLKIRVRDAAGQVRQADAALEDFAERIAAMPDGARKTSLAIEALGEKLGPRLIPFLNQGKAGIQELREEARRLGLSISEESAKQAEQFNDNLTRLGQAGAGVARVLASELLPRLVAVTEELARARSASSLLKSVWENMKENTIFGSLKAPRIELEQLNQQVTNAAANLAMLIRQQQGDPWNPAYEARIKKARQDLEDLQKKALEASNALKAEANFQAPEPKTGETAPGNAKASRFTPDLPSKAPAAQSRMAQFEAILQHQRQVYGQAMLEQGKFQEWGRQEEANYWAGILRRRDLSKDERIAVEQKLYAAERDIRKEAYDAEVGELKLKLAAAKDHWARQSELAAQAAELARQRYGEDSKEYKAALAEKQKLELEHQGKLREIATIRRDAQRAVDEAAIEEQERQAQFEYDLGLRTAESLLTVRRQAAEQRLAVELAAIDAEQAAWGAETLEFERLESRKVEARRRFHQQAADIDRERAAARLLPMGSAIGLGEDAMLRSLDALVEKGRNAEAELGNIWRSAGATFIREMVTRPITQWIAMQARKLAMNAGFIATKTAQDSAGAAASLAAEQSTGAASIAVHAYRAAAGAYAAIAQIPVVGPVLAPVTAAAALAAVMAFGKRIFSAEGGFDIPAGVNPLVQAHAREMILPAKHADVIRSLADGRGGAGGGDTHNWHIKALDGPSFERWLKAGGGDAMIRYAQGKRRNFGVS